MAGAPLLSMFVFLLVFAGISGVGVFTYRRFAGDRRRQHGRQQ